MRKFFQDSDKKIDIKIIHYNSLIRYSELIILTYIILIVTSFRILFSTKYRDLLRLLLPCHHPLMVSRRPDFSAPLAGLLPERCLSMMELYYHLWFPCGLRDGFDLQILLETLFLNQSISWCHRKKAQKNKKTCHIFSYFCYFLILVNHMLKIMT